MTLRPRQSAPAVVLFHLVKTARHCCPVPADFDLLKYALLRRSSLRFALCLPLPVSPSSVGLRRIPLCMLTRPMKRLSANGKAHQQEMWQCLWGNIVQTNIVGNCLRRADEKSTCCKIGFIAILSSNYTCNCSSFNVIHWKWNWKVLSEVGATLWEYFIPVY